MTICFLKNLHRCFDQYKDISEIHRCLNISEFGITSYTSTHACLNTDQGAYHSYYRAAPKTFIETNRTVIKGVTNLLGNSWTRCWSFSFIWRFCCFQIRKFHIRHLKSQNLPPIRMPNIRISWDVGQQKRLFCSSLLMSLVGCMGYGLLICSTPWLELGYYYVC